MKAIFRLLTPSFYPESLLQLGYLFEFASISLSLQGIWAFQAGKRQETALILFRECHPTFQHENSSYELFSQFFSYFSDCSSSPHSRQRTHSHYAFHLNSNSFRFSLINIRIIYTIIIHQLLIYNLHSLLRYSGQSAPILLASVPALTGTKYQFHSKKAIYKFSILGFKTRADEGSCRVCFPYWKFWCKLVFQRLTIDVPVKIPCMKQKLNHSSSVAQFKFNLQPLPAITDLEPTKASNQVLFSFFRFLYISGKKTLCCLETKNKNVRQVFNLRKLSQNQIHGQRPIKNKKIQSQIL